jgi:hypothetical protein
VPVHEAPPCLLHNPPAPRYPMPGETIKTPKTNRATSRQEAKTKLRPGDRQADPAQRRTSELLVYPVYSIIRVF